MPFSTEMRTRVARADLEMQQAFSLSIMRWQERSPISHEVDGDCTESVALLDIGQVLHVNGNLEAEVESDGHHEIVIGGDVTKNSTIHCSGFCSIFINGSFNGSIQSTDLVKIWIGSNCSGTITTGHPSTDIRIVGNYDGKIEPRGNPSLLYLAINGFAANESLSRISDLGFTQFNAAVAISDVEPGLYPLSNHRKKTDQGNSFGRWSIESRKEV